MKITSDQMPFLAQYGSEKHLDQMFEKVHNFPSIAGSEIIRNPFATKRHLEQVPISDYIWSDKHDLVKHPNLPDNYREEFLKSGTIGLQNTLLKRPDTTKEHLKTILRSENTGPEIAENVAKHPLADVEVLHVGLDHPASYIRYNMIADGKNVDRSHIERALKDKASTVRSIGLHHRFATSDERKHAAFHDSNDSVRVSIMNRPDFPSEDLKKIHKTADSQISRQHALTILHRRGEDA